MPAKALVFALLLSCSNLAVMALSLTEEPLRDPPMRAPTPLTISKVNWKMEANTTLQLCCNEDLLPGQASLVWGEPGGSTATVEETVDDNDLKCSTFQMDSSFVLPASETFYQLVFSFEDGYFGMGSIVFAMTAQTSILECGHLNITKLSWTTESPIAYKDSCITTGAIFDFDCYLAASFSNRDLCFLVNDDTITVCLNGPIQPILSNGELSVNYLAYGETGVLSLNFADQDMSNLRAIVRLADDPANPGSPGPATVFECPNGVCSMPEGIEPLYKIYEVCGEARVAADGSPPQTAVTTIIDLNLVPFPAGARANVLEFVFANGLGSMRYTASLYDTAPPYELSSPTLDTSTVDCTGVAEGHACFGFFSTDATGELFIALSDMDETNTIIATTTIQKRL